MNKLNSKIMTYIVVIALFAAAVYFVSAANFPLGAQSITEGQDTHVNYSQYPATSHNAIAGNITEINISGTSQTRHWQGYYGEITGTLVLDDAQNWTLYEWTINEPEGEIYATVNNTPTWETISCYDVSNYTVNTRWETFYNMSYYTEDGINETFDDQNHPVFAVGDQTFAAGDCYNIFTYVADKPQTNNFFEVLLTDEDDRLIFMTNIENDDAANNTDPYGFDNRRHDFQMIVAEDGTSWNGGTRNLDTTPYYFYLEME